MKSETGEMLELLEARIPDMTLAENRCMVRLIFDIITKQQEQIQAVIQEVAELREVVNGKANRK